MRGRPEDELFTFEDQRTDPPTRWHFNVSEMWRYIRALPPGNPDGLIYTEHPLPIEWVEQCLLPMGMHEEARVEQLTDERLAVPVLGMLWDDGTTVLIDGTHRMIRKYRDKVPTIEMILFPLELRERFRIDLPGRGALDISSDRIPEGPMGDWLRKRGVV